MDRAAICTLGAPFDTEMASASDTLAAQISEAQIDVAEGPGWDAYRSQVPLLLPDLSQAPPSRWPLFLSAIATLDVHAIYSFPLAVGELKIGSVDLYSHETRTLTAADVADATALALSTSAEVLQYAVDHRYDEPVDNRPHSRREIHQATGMVIAQAGVSAADALLMIRAHAFATGRPMREIAADITARRISLER